MQFWQASIVVLLFSMSPGVSQGQEFPLLSWFSKPKEINVVAFEAYAEPASAKAYDKYILPNEFNNQLQMGPQVNSFARPTAVISVGTLRTFNLAGVLRRDILIAMDYGSTVVSFNKHLAQMILKLDRKTFLQELMGGAGEFDLTHRSQFLQRLDFLMANPNATVFKTDLGAEMKSRIDRTQHEERRQTHWKIWLEALHKYAESEESWKGCFFSEEGAYQHLKKMIRENRFVAVTGSLSGKKTLIKIAAELKQMRVVVSEIDLSNALEHIVAYERQPGLNRLATNLQALPLPEGSRVLFTMDKLLLQDESFLSPFPQSAKWIYAAATRKQIIESIRGTTGTKSLDEHLLEIVPIGGQSCRGLLLR